MAKTDPHHAKRLLVAAQTAARLQGQVWDKLDAPAQERYLKVLRTILAAVREFDHKVRAAQVREGIAKARNGPRKSSAPRGRPKLSAETEAKIRALLSAGATYNTIRAETGVGGYAITRIKTEMGIARVHAGSATDQHRQPGDLQVQQESHG